MAAVASGVLTVFLGIAVGAITGIGFDGPSGRESAPAVQAPAQVSAEGANQGAGGEAIVCAGQQIDTSFTQSGSVYTLVGTLQGFGDGEVTVSSPGTDIDLILSDPSLGSEFLAGDAVKVEALAAGAGNLEVTNMTSACPEAAVQEIAPQEPASGIPPAGPAPEPQPAPEPTAEPLVQAAVTTIAGLDAPASPPPVPVPTQAALPTTPPWLGEGHKPAIGVLAPSADKPAPGNVDSANESDDDDDEDDSSGNGHGWDDDDDQDSNNGHGHKNGGNPKD
jgi:hypothetical protein